MTSVRPTVRQKSIRERHNLVKRENFRLRKLIKKQHADLKTTKRELKKLNRWGTVCTLSDFLSYQLKHMRRAFAVIDSTHPKIYWTTEQMLLQRQSDKQTGTNLFDKAVNHLIENAGLVLDEDSKEEWRSIIIRYMRTYDERNNGSRSSLVQNKPTPDIIQRVNDLIFEIPHQHELKHRERMAFVWALTEYRRRTCGLKGSAWIPHHLLRGTTRVKSM
jgi:hypothetical protein